MTPVPGQIWVGRDDDPEVVQIERIDSTVYFKNLKTGTGWGINMDGSIEHFSITYFNELYRPGESYVVDLILSKYETDI